MAQHLKTERRLLEMLFERDIKISRLLCGSQQESDDDYQNFYHTAVQLFSMIRSRDEEIVQLQRALAENEFEERLEVHSLKSRIAEFSTELVGLKKKYHHVTRKFRAMVESQDRRATEWVFP